MSFLSSASSIQKSTVLVTGGGTGIGLALSKKLIGMGHTVIVVGRRQAQLDEAKSVNPKLNIIQGDVGSDISRIALFQKVINDFPEVNVLINNAAIAEFAGPLLKDTTPAAWEQHKTEIEINLVGPIHLSTLFLPHFVSKPHALIVNVTSVVAFFPVAVGSTYSATKGGN